MPTLTEADTCRTCVIPRLQAAGDKDVIIIGAASTAQQCIRAGLADELHIDIMPVLLGGGLRLFDDTGIDPVQLERIKVVELPGDRTNLQFRFAK